MAPLSRELAGVILDHESYGKHLDASGKTVDPELEVKNFEKAGETLAEIWNRVVIDEFDVSAEYIRPEGKDMGTKGTSTNPKFRNETWKAIHVRQSRYCLQIIKCDDRQCCSPRRSNIADIIPGGFLPPPVPYKRSERGLAPATLAESTQPGVFYGSLSTRLALRHLDPKPDEYQSLPFDYYCPSQTETLKNRHCLHCGQTFVIQTALKSHSTVHKTSKQAIVVHINTQKEAQPQPEAQETDQCHIIQDIEQWRQATFVEITQEMLQDAEIIQI